MKIVLAYSGGLDTSVAIVWLKEKYDAEIVGFCSDVGQGEDLEAARKKALRTGAVSCHVLDQRDEFVRDFVFPAVRAARGLRGRVLPGHGAGAPLHRPRHDGGRGARGRDRHRARLDRQGQRPGPLRAGRLLVQPVASRSSRPGANGSSSRARELHRRSPRHKKIPVEATASKPYSIDRNLLHTSYEGGILEDPDAEPPAEMFQRTADPRDAPDEPREVDDRASRRGRPSPSTASRWGRRRCSPS